MQFILFPMQCVCSSSVSFVLWIVGKLRPSKALKTQVVFCIHANFLGGLDFMQGLALKTSWFYFFQNSQIIIIVIP